VDPERQRYFDLFRRALEGIPHAAPPGDGRGIVTCGSLRFTPLLWLLVRGLRFHGCSLPIELWHLPGEVDDALQRLLEPQGVAFRAAPDPVGRSTSHPRAVHALKPYAIAYSRFREVLFLDADNCAFRDPTLLFESREFRRHRAIFWPDWGPMTQHLGGPQLRRDFGLRDDAQVEFESGQMVLDKCDRWPALAATLHLNEHSDYYYRFLFGDKETFRLAFDLLASDYFLVPLRPVHRKGLVHFWTDTQPLFHHRCGGIKRTLLKPRNLPALPRSELRESLRLLSRHWKPPLRDRLDVYGRALQHFMEMVTSPPTVRQALAKRIRRGLAWMSEWATP
jgi:alpha 1,2-mannosyltransferase